MPTDSVVLAAVLSGVGGALAGATATWFGQRQLSAKRQSWDLRLQIYSKYLEAVALMSHQSGEVIRARRELTLAKMQIVVAGSAQVVKSLEDFEVQVTSTPGLWTETSEGRSAFSGLVVAIRQDLEISGAVGQAAIEQILLPHTRQ
jgi:hypothetical protein